MFTQNMQSSLFLVAQPAIRALYEKLYLQDTYSNFLSANYLSYIETLEKLKNFKISSSNAVLRANGYKVCSIKRTFVCFTRGGGGV